MKMAEATEEELQALLVFGKKLQEIVDNYCYFDEGWKYDGLDKLVNRFVNEKGNLSFNAERIVGGYRTMFENVCDQSPEVTCLEFNAEIKVSLAKNFENVVSDE